MEIHVSHTRTSQYVYQIRGNSEQFGYQGQIITYALFFVGPLKCEPHLYLRTSIELTASANQTRVAKQILT